MEPSKSLDKHTDLITLRIRMGLTLRELSTMTGLSPATLHRLERGLIKPSARSMVRLQDGLGLTHEQVERILANSAKKLHKRRRGA